VSTLRLTAVSHISATEESVNVNTKRATTGVKCNANLKLKHIAKARLLRPAAARIKYSSFYAPVALTGRFLRDMSESPKRLYPSMV
jgi:hypothetical protein